MAVKTSELTGAALDWAVGNCAGVLFNLNLATKPPVMHLRHQKTSHGSRWIPTQKWSQGGVIIERECISIQHCWNEDEESPAVWQASIDDTLVEEQGETPLIAAMRCYVACRLGNEIEIPKELE